MSETYTEMRNRHQQMVNSLPMFFAFSQEQFEEGMAAFGLSPNDTNKIYSLGGGTGGYYKRSDAELIRDTFATIEAEEQQAMTDDKTGDGYIFQMFVYELDNHEYSYTNDIEETLNDIGLTEKEVMNCPALMNGLRKAIQHIRTRKKRP